MGQQENLLNLERPEFYYCQVWGYIRGHSRMFVRIHPSGDFYNEQYVLFAEIYYFEGPLDWWGAHFALGSTEECRIILDKIGLGEYPELFNLFVVKQDGIDIKIVARGISLHDSAPVAQRA